MGTRFIPRRGHRLSALGLLPLLFALFSVMSCGILQVGIEETATPVGGDPVATVAALAAGNAHLSTRVAALVSENAQQATQVAALATENAQQATQVAALATENARQAAAVAELAASKTAEPGQWAFAASMTVARTMHTATLLPDGRVLLVGGYTRQDADTAQAEIYDPVSGTYRPAGSLNTARHQHSTTLLQDGRILVIGGYNPTQGWLGSAELYDPTTGRWTVTQPLFAHGVTHTATLLEDGRVLVIGGNPQSGHPAQDDRVEIFDPRTDSWQPAAHHEGTEAGHTATLLTDGRVLIAAGGTDPAVYDPVGDTWQPAGHLAVSRWMPQAVRLTDGRVLLVGGLDVSGGSPIDNVDIYDPAGNSWQQAAPLAQARYLHTATLLPDGRVLVIAGARLLDSSWDDPGVVLDSVEAYDPASDSWSALPPLRQARAYHTATLLPDGSVFVAGGEAAHNIILDSTEILTLAAR
jgi:Galactose oxidase, central domain/Kelch motif